MRHQVLGLGITVDLPFLCIVLPQDASHCWVQDIIDWAYFHALLSNVGGCHFLYCTGWLETSHVTFSELRTVCRVIQIVDSGFGSLSP